MPSNNHINVEVFSRALDMVLDWFIFGNTQITMFTCFTFIPKTSMGLPKTGIIFYCASSPHHQRAPQLRRSETIGSIRIAEAGRLRP